MKLMVVKVIEQTQFKEKFFGIRIPDLEFLVVRDIVKKFPIGTEIAVRVKGFFFDEIPVEKDKTQQYRFFMDESQAENVPYQQVCGTIYIRWDGRHVLVWALIKDETGDYVSSYFYEKEVRND